MLDVLLEVSTTLSPAQNVRGPLAATVGTAGFGLTVTVVAADAAVQPEALLTVTEYVPLVETTILCVVAPVLHTLFVAELEDKVTVPPEQNETGPLAVTTGVDGFGFTVTVVAAEPAVHPLALETTTEYVPDVFTVIACVVAPVLHKYDVATLDVSVTEPPVQKVVGPFAVIVGVVGAGFTVTVYDAIPYTPQDPLLMLT